jgi:hypothetical protein
MDLALTVLTFGYGKHYRFYRQSFTLRIVHVIKRRDYPVVASQNVRSQFRPCCRLRTNIRCHSVQWPRSNIFRIGRAWHHMKLDMDAAQSAISM